MAVELKCHNIDIIRWTQERKEKEEKKGKKIGYNKIGIKGIKEIKHYFEKVTLQETYRNFTKR